MLNIIILLLLLSAKENDKNNDLGENYKKLICYIRGNPTGEGPNLVPRVSFRPSLSHSSEREEDGNEVGEGPRTLMKTTNLTKTMILQKLQKFAMLQVTQKEWAQGP